MTLSANKPFVIFDLDGTLFQTDTITVPAVKMAFDDFGLPAVSDDVICRSIGCSWPAFLSQLEIDIPDEMRDSLAVRISAYEMAYLKSSGRLYPGVIDVISALQQSGFMLAVCTNGSQEYTEQVLTHFGIRSAFAHVVSCDGEQSKAEGIRQILTVFGQQTAIIIGDRLSDLHSARATGCASIGVAYGYGGDEVLKADMTVTSPTDLIDAIHLSAIFLALKDLIANKRQQPTIVGVNGVDCSGKTTFAAAFCEWLNRHGTHAVLINLDDFHNPRAQRQQGVNPIEAYYHNAFDLDRLMCQVLAPLRRDGQLAVELEVLNLDTDTYDTSRYYEIRPESVVLVEGVLLFRPPLQDYFDIRVFLHIDFEEVLKRAEMRDVPRFGVSILTDYREKYIPVQQRYLHEYSPIKQADLVIDNTDVTRPRIIQ